mmetsp:Transcript_88249/g.176482  ORF Transcript_88249/g.176482 Transcript_88249/m.176482 type:complete len:404 (+) Transcript_88249:60-1271(+)
MVPETARGSRKRKFPGPISLLDVKPNLAGAGLEDPQSLLGQHDVIDLQGSQAESEVVLWQSEVWLSAWSVLNLSPVHSSAQSEAHERAMKAGGIDTPMCLLPTMALEKGRPLRSGVSLVAIESVQHHGDKDSTVNLIDPTGIANAYIHCKVLEDLGPEFTVGAVMLLRNAAVVHNRGEAGGLYLNVTPDNMAMLWPASTRFDKTNHRILQEEKSRVHALGSGVESAFQLHSPNPCQSEPTDRIAPTLGCTDSQPINKHDSSILISDSMEPRKNQSNFPRKALGEIDETDTSSLRLSGNGQKYADSTTVLCASAPAAASTGSASVLQAGDEEDWMWDIVSKEEESALETGGQKTGLRLELKSQALPSKSILVVSQLNSQVVSSAVVRAIAEDEDDDLLDDIFND